MSSTAASDKDLDGCEWTRKGRRLRGVSRIFPYTKVLRAPVVGERLRWTAQRIGNCLVAIYVAYARDLRPVPGNLFPRTHKLKGADNLLAVRVHVNLASGAIAELVLIIGWNRVAEHQRINDPDCSRLHCETPHVRPLAENERQPHPSPIVTEAADQVHPATIAFTGKATSPQFPAAESWQSSLGLRVQALARLSIRRRKYFHKKQRENVLLTWPRHEQHVLESAGRP
jgi:hypothetical protein